MTKIDRADRLRQRPMGSGNPSTSNLSLTLFLIIITLLYWAVLVFEFPLFEKLPGWSWPLDLKPPASWFWMVPLVLVPVALIFLALTKNRSRWVILPLFMVLGATMQYGLAFLDGQGMHAMESRAIFTGGNTFANVAASQSSISEALVNYREIVSMQQEGKEYLATKPPGNLAIFMFTECLASWIHPTEQIFEKTAWLWTFASYTWPALSQLVLIPLFLLSETVFDQARGRWACALYVLVPTVNLITLHTDQTVFPLVFVSIALLGVMSFLHGGIGLAFVAGVLTYLAVFCSFGLAIIVVLLLGFGLAAVPTDLWLARIFLVAKFFCSFLLGMGLVALLFMAWLHYDIWLHYREAMLQHHSIMGWAWSLRHYLYFPVLNFVEFSVMTGLPIAFFAFFSLIRSVQTAFAKTRDLASMMPMIVWISMLILSVAGRTRGEVARLWLFLVPCFCLVASDEILSRFGSRDRWAMPTVCVLQWGTTILTKISYGL